MIRFRMLILLLLVVVFSGGCKSIRELTSGSVNWKTVETRALAEQLDFSAVSISGKVKLDYPEGGFSNLSANYRINIVKDSAIMIRVVKLIEAARILITTDSIYVQDRINSNFITCDFGLAEEMIGLPADFQMIQALLLGQYAPIPSVMEVIQKRGTPKVFAGKAAGMDFLYELDAGLAKPTKITATDPNAGRTVVMGYQDFQDGPGAAYPSECSIEVSGTDELSVTFTHRKVSFSDDRSLVSFDVPSGYTRSNCR